MIQYLKLGNLLILGGKYDNKKHITIAILAITMVASSVAISFAEGTATQSTYKSGSGTVVLQGIFTDSTLAAENAVDYSQKLTTSGTLNKTYCFSITINNIAEWCLQEGQDKSQLV